MHKYAAALEQAETIEALWEGLVDRLTRHGISQVIYITAEGTPPRAAQLLCTCPDLYDGTAPSSDPFLAHCCNSYDITKTGPEFLQIHEYLDDRDKAFIRTARDQGFLTGFGIPTRLRGAERYGGFNLGTTLSRDRFLKRMWPRREEFRLFCLLVHRRIEELAGRSVADAPALIAPDLAPGVSGLSPREAEVLFLVGRGMSRKEIARTCGISLHTASEYTKSVYRKLGLRNRAEAAQLVYRLAEAG